MPGSVSKSVSGSGRLVRVEAPSDGSSHDETPLTFDLRYATADNICGRVLYRGARLYLRFEAAETLKRAAALAAARGLGLWIFDGYRPNAVQGALWGACPDARYVLPPFDAAAGSGGSMHTRGVAADLTLAEWSGSGVWRPLAMGSGFDEMGLESHWDARERGLIGESEQANRVQLREIMWLAGFETIDTEWWHYQLPSAFAEGGEWPILDESSLPDGPLSHPDLL